MPIAAVPRYLGENFQTASPGLRFGLYLQIWMSRKDQEEQVYKRARGGSPEAKKVRKILETQGLDRAIAILCQSEKRPLPGLWKKNEEARQQVWAQVCCLEEGDQERMKAVCARQAAMADSIAPEQLLSVHARSIAPFTTGLGNEHALENGFAFLNPYGLPYLPGSGVKGVLRKAAAELAGLAPARWTAASDWSGTYVDALFGSQDSEKARRGALSFWDVMPQITGKGLTVEVVTPHQQHYYQGVEPPHDSGAPVPSFFLTVPPGADFTFHVQCDYKLLPEELRHGERWKALLREAFVHAFDWLGFGAKTAVGYGAMRYDEEREVAERRRREREEAARKAAEAEAARKAAEAEAERRRQAEFDALPEEEKVIRGFQEALAAIRGDAPLGKDEYSRLKGMISALAQSATAWGATERRRAAEVIEAAFERYGWAPSGLKADKRKKQEAKNRELVAGLRSSGA